VVSQLVFSLNPLAARPPATSKDLGAAKQLDAARAASLAAAFVDELRRAAEAGIEGALAAAGVFSEAAAEAAARAFQGAVEAALEERAAAHNAQVWWRAGKGCGACCALLAGMLRALEHS
jgi:hypothetical protein